MMPRRPSRLAAAPALQLWALAWLCLAVLAASVPAAARDLPYGHGVLWQVSREGTPPSHVFGTLHLSDKRVTTLPAPVAQAFDSAGSLTVETIRTPEQEPHLLRRMTLPEGRLLDAIIGAELYDEVVAAVGRYGVPTRNLHRFKPWAVLTTIGVPLQEFRRQRAGRMPLDLTLIQRGQARAIPVFALETLDEQLDLFDKMTEEDQITMLRQAVQDSGRISELVESMTRYYLARDLNGLLKWLERQMAGQDPRMARLFWSRLINARNAVMVERMQDRLAAGAAFVAVGAAHLPGEKGVIALLHARGYAVKRVY